MGEESGFFNDGFSGVIIVLAEEDIAMEVMNSHLSGDWRWKMKGDIIILYPSEITHGIGVAPEVEEQGGKKQGRGKSREPNEVREQLGDFETQVAKVELHLIDGEDNFKEKFEELDTRIEELDQGVEEFHEEM
ncbi:hypothetical protein GH714_040081 [Hevea brasiliensis]|uniref:Uncharacterized protein n=1 Tax=Hevea brasiliensis TaxID=3981 RepID=A0A6A6MP21_HEVBR|nr:hypothetical protein GH714_040081 [Hevea brasiliensis]